MTRKVKVIATTAKRRWKLRWFDPGTGRERQRKVDADDRADAHRLAGQLQAELDAGNVVVSRHVLWTDFKERYLAEHVATLAVTTRAGVKRTFRQIDRVLSLRRLADLDASRISLFQAELRRLGRAEQTINHHLRNLRAALRWAVDLEMIPKAPRIRFARGVKGPKMKGGHVSDADFLRALEAIPEVVPTVACESWRFFLRGLWVMGWRLGDALKLDWSAEDRSRVDLASREFIVLGEDEKGRRNRRLPMIPECYDLLCEVPPEERRGRVFKFAGPRGGLTDDKSISRRASAIFRQANVYAVNGEKSRHATLHDLRRSFGQRMAERYPWTVLRLLMRHEDLKTTLDFYVGEDVESAKRLIWLHGEASERAAV